jgi:hypothetical protein
MAIYEKNDINLDFTPVASLARMFTATPNEKFVFVFGPIGSTKTTSCLFWLLMRAAAQAPSPDGIRRTRFALIRNTLLQLKATVLKDILSLFGKMAEYRPSENTVWIKVADVETEWLLMSLEREEDQRRLLSLQLSGVYINEVREVNYDLVFAAFSRTGRFPSAKHGGVPCTYRFLLADSNMGTKGSKLYNFLVKEKRPEVMFIHQPGAMSSRADWIQYLPHRYYEDLQIGQTKAWIDTHVHARWSHDLTGEPIFAASFFPDFHVAKQPLQVYPYLPLTAGIDPGLNPACVIGQRTSGGQVRVLKEIHAANMLFGQFLDTMVIPACQGVGFAGVPIYFYIDPSGINRHTTTNLSAKGMLEDRGIDVTVASTNATDPRLKAIENLLTAVRPSEEYVTSFDGDYNENEVEQSTSMPSPAFLVDPGCVVLRAALEGEYRYKKKRSGELEVEPEKRHPISDVVDATGYMILGHGDPRFMKKISRFRGRSGFDDRIDPRAWT